MYAYSTMKERTETATPFGRPVSKRDALFLKAQSMLRTRIREAMASASLYQVLSMTGASLLSPGKTEMRRNVPYATAVVVDPVCDTCTCHEHGPGGIVTRNRAALLAAGFTQAELIEGQAWPQCSHQLTLAILQMEYVTLGKEGQNA